MSLQKNLKQIMNTLIKNNRKFHYQHNTELCDDSEIINLIMEIRSFPLPEEEKILENFNLTWYEISLIEELEEERKLEEEQILSIKKQKINKKIKSNKFNALIIDEFDSDFE